MKRKRGFQAIFIMAGCAVCGAFASCAGDRSSGPRTRMVAVGTHRLEIRIEGVGSPAVVIDSGLADTLDKLRPLQERLARTNRVVTYNRAGYGMSDPGPLPRDSGREAVELKTLLEKASVPGPYVLVGHSLGALNMLMFASKYPGDVAGMVLLDPPPLSFLLGRDYAELRTMAEKMTAEWQAAADSGAGSADAGERGKAAFFRMIASEHREMFGESATTAESIAGFGGLPLAVLAAGKPNPAFGAVAEEYQTYWIGQSRALAGRSANGAFALAEGSSHYLYLDAPELVEKEVLAVVEAARKRVAAVAAAAPIIARCAEAMGGMERIKAVRTLRLEVVYPDHDASAVLHEISRPNRIRTERAGNYVALFDGRRGTMLKYDPAKPGRPPVLQNLPPGSDRGFETDLIWFFPALFDYPAEYGGIMESGGKKFHTLVVTLPLGTRAEYRIDARTHLIGSIAVDETFEGKAYHMEREWLDLRPVEGILYPSRMSYPGRGGTTAVAEIKMIAFNEERRDASNGKEN